MWLLEIIGSEEVKDKVDSLLKRACGDVKNIKHCMFKNRDFET
jgi:hypothetical protein